MSRLALSGSTRHRAALPSVGTLYSPASAETLVGGPGCVAEITGKAVGA
jgi:hypothetical protein